MDPLSALGLASNIVQFLDFTWNLITETKRIATSVDGVSSENRLLETIMSDMQELTKSIAPSPNSNPQLKKLAAECGAISSDILNALAALKAKGQHTCWDSFLLALKQAWKKGKVEKLTSRLDRAHSQLASHMQTIMMSDMSDLKKAIQSLNETSERFGIETREKLGHLGDQVANVTQTKESDRWSVEMQKYLDALHGSENAQMKASQDIAKRLDWLTKFVIDRTNSEQALRDEDFISTMQEYVTMLQRPLHQRSLGFEITRYITDFLRQPSPPESQTLVDATTGTFVTKETTGGQDPPAENDQTTIKDLPVSAEECTPRGEPSDPRKDWDTSRAEALNEMIKSIEPLCLSGDSSFNMAENVSDHLGRFRNSLEGLERASRTMMQCQAFLKRLHFPSIKSRQRKVETAHSKTFEWILEEPDRKSDSRHHFVEWLRNENRPFWVQGKAGSGKSTLMKFITDHPKTQKYLRVWAGRKRLIVASFFFWNAGTPLQCSQEGLLRSLLFEILRICPELIPSVATLHLGESFEDADDSFRLQELLDIYGKILKQPDIHTKFCFFVDGLDEFHEQPRPQRPDTNAS